MQLPGPFKKYLEKNNIDPIIYEKKIDRYIMWNSYFPFDPDQLLKDFGGKRLTGPYEKLISLPGDSNVANKFLYKQGKVIGVDISSVVAIKALDLHQDDQFLDLCCAPGIKLAIGAQEIGMNGTGSATGVDISLERLFNCRSLLQRLKVGKVRVFNQNGTSFHELAPKAVSLSVPSKRKTMENQKCFYESTLFRRKKECIEYTELYDKIIVDVECTHDGSIKHIQKLIANGDWESFLSRFEEPNYSNLLKLQLSLLRNGYSLLKKGGSLIYSTCSLSKDQNQGILEYFFSIYPEAKLMDISQWMPVNITVDDCEFPGQEHVAKKFNPIISNTSGLFIAKIKKCDLQ